MDIKEALGRVAAEDVYAKKKYPAQDNSAMDGYAVIVNHVEGASKEKPCCSENYRACPQVISRKAS